MMDELLCPAEVYFQGLTTLYQGLIRRGVFDRSEYEYIVDDLASAIKSAHLEAASRERLNEHLATMCIALEREVDAREILPGLVWIAE